MKLHSSIIRTINPSCSLRILSLILAFVQASVELMFSVHLGSTVFSNETCLWPVVRLTPNWKCLEQICFAFFWFQLVILQHCRGRRASCTFVIRVTFIDRFFMSICPPERKLLPYQSRTRPLIAILMVHATRSEVDNIKSKTCRGRTISNFGEKH